jgi:hypothetical protein
MNSSETARLRHSDALDGIVFQFALDAPLRGVQTRQ